MFINLINNAAEASPAGDRVAVTVEREGAPAGRRSPGSIVAKVTDKGHGIDEATCRTLFEPFFTSKRNSGTGLGLSTSRRLIEAHGGHIGFDSNEKVTTFWFELPRTKMTAEPVEEQLARINAQSNV